MNNIDENTKRYVSMIVAIGKDRAIGKGNELLWRIPDDMKRFRTLTSGHPVIMGRKTWESLPEKFRPLPGRVNVVVSRQERYEAKGAAVVSTLAAGLAIAAEAPGSEEIFVIGGAQLYTEALPFANRLYVTVINDQKEADVFFPEYEKEFTKIISSEKHEHEGITYEWLTLERP